MVESGDCGDNCIYVGINDADGSVDIVDNVSVLLLLAKATAGRTVVATLK
jgi:hypothetical protein